MQITQQIQTQKTLINAVLAKCKIVNSEFQNNENLQNLDLPDLPEPKNFGLISWKNVKINEVCNNISAGGDKPNNFSESKTDNLKIPVFANGKENDGLIGYTKEAKIFEPCLTIAARGTIGFCAIRQEPFVPVVRLIVAIPNSKIINLKLFKYIVSSIEFVNTGGTIPQLTVPYFSQYKIPLPPLDAQEKIVQAINNIEQNINNLQTNLENLKLQQNQILQKYLF